MAKTKLKNPISRSPEIMSGTPVFAGTRVPVQTFLDYVEGGHTVKEFRDDFPTVKKNQIAAVMLLIKKKILSKVA